MLNHEYAAGTRWLAGSMTGMKTLSREPHEQMLFRSTEKCDNFQNQLLLDEKMNASSNVKIVMLFSSYVLLEKKS